MKLFNILFCSIFMITCHTHSMQLGSTQKKPSTSTLQKICSLPLFCCTCIFSTASYIREKGCKKFLEVGGTIADVCYEELWNQNRKMPLTRPAPAPQTMPKQK